MNNVSAVSRRRASDAQESAAARGRPALTTPRLESGQEQRAAKLLIVSK
jgi:hypothetical protein